MFGIFSPHSSNERTMMVGKAINRQNYSQLPNEIVVFFRTSSLLMLLWCNEAFGASEAEDQLTASSLISHPALFEEIYTRCGD